MFHRALPAVLATATLLAGCKKDAPAPPAAPAAAGPAAAGPAAATPAPSGEAPAQPAATLDPSAPADVAALAKTLLAGATEPAAQVQAIVAGLRTRTTLLPPERPLGRDPLSPADVAKALAAAPAEPLALTGIECGGAAAALIRAIGQDPAPSLVFPDGGGKTNFRLRAIAVNAPDPTVPCGAPLAKGTPSAPLAKGAEAAQYLGLSALRLAEQQDVGKALEQLAEARKTAADDAAVVFLDGQLQAIRGELDNGMDLMEKAVASAEDADGQYQLAVAYLRAGERFSAFKALNRATELYPKHTRALAALGNLHIERWQELPEDQRPTVEAELDRIEKELAAVGPDAPGLAELRVQRLRLAGKTEEAEKAALAAVATSPRAPLHMLLADMAIAKGDTAAAEKQYELAAAADPYDAEPLVQLAQQQANRGDIDKTIATLADATRRAPHDVDLLANYANLLMQVGRNDEAAKAATELKNRFPEAADGYALLAQIALQSGDMAGANALLEQALAKNEKALDLYVMLYIGYVMGGTPEKAPAVVDRLLKQDPDGRMRIAQALLQTGQVEGATGLLEKEHEVNPGRLEVSITLAQIYLLGGKTDAVERLRKGVESEPDNLATFDNALAEMKKQMEEAEKSKPPAGADAPAPGGFPMVDPGGEPAP